jgi:hypothetical protein
MSQTRNDTFALMLSPRQLIAVCSMSFSVVWLIAALAYVAGHAKTAELPAGMAFGAEPLVIDPVRWPERGADAGLGARLRVTRAAASEAEPAITQQPVTQPGTAQPAMTQIATAESVIVEPEKGQRFWQVRVVERDTAPVYVEFLKKLSLPARAAASTDPLKVRILVGPLADTDEQEALRKSIAQAGLPYYLRKY